MTGRGMDPVTLSVLSAALSSIAEEMGAVLVRSAYSSNIKERRDCSAALFDRRGRMVAQAEHIPVHLGAMPESVTAVMAEDPRPGDIFLLNDPYRGGTHLPDVTMVAPVSIAAGDIVGFTITRAHHSDVGGMRAGSMPGSSTEIFQEGLVIPPVRVVERGRPRTDVLALILANVRTPELRRGDLRAQAAACELGARRLLELADRRGLELLVTSFQEVTAYTERIARAVIAAIPDGDYAAEDVIEGDGVIDDDIPIRAQVTVSGETITIDFAGSAGAVAGNVNCPMAVTRSACYFALRTLLPDDVPSNGGLYEPLTVRAPGGSVVNARPPSAVAAGNVETSQRIADVVLAALGRATDVPAQGQGTMNNVVMGGRSWTYYETIGGGQGASSRGPGPSGVHVGMSNTLNTPIEALELEYPLRVEAQQLIYNSGGAGTHRGGDGIERSVRVLEPATLSLLTDRRRRGPAGADGGEPGSPGRNLVNGEEVGAKVDLELGADDVVTIRTPGGGGWGNSPLRDR